MRIVSHFLNIENKLKEYNLYNKSTRRYTIKDYIYKGRTYTFIYNDYGSLRIYDNKVLVLHYDNNQSGEIILDYNEKFLTLVIGNKQWITHLSEIYLLIKNEDLLNKNKYEIRDIDRKIATVNKFNKDI